VRLRFAEQEVAILKQQAEQEVIMRKQQADTQAGLKLLEAKLIYKEAETELNVMNDLQETTELDRLF